MKELRNVRFMGNITYKDIVVLTKNCFFEISGNKVLINKNGNNFVYILSKNPNEYSNFDILLFKKVKDDANLFLKYRKNIECNYEPKMFSFYNKYGLEKNQKSNIVAIDINNCYWNTAKKIGIITENTFDFGLNNCSKKVRNASIGNLAKKTNVYYNNNGIIEKIKVIEPQTSKARYLIIKHVFDITMKILNEIKDDFLFFYTDCFYVNEKRLNEVVDILKNFGYETKYATCEIKEIVETTNFLKMNWINKKGAQVTSFFNKSQYI